MSLFVIYGFDTASTLSEETRDPRRAAPKAVLFSVIGAFVIGGVFLLGTLVAIPNLHAAIKGAYGPAQIIEANFSHPSPPSTCWWCRRRSSSAACRSWPRRSGCASGCPATTSCRSPAAVQGRSPSLHTPVWACIAIAVLAAIPFLQFSGAGIIAIAATGMIYLSYFLGNLVILRARLRGWPKASAPFRLGRWGLAVNVIGLLYGGAMLVNFAWPRAASNPEPNQTVIAGVQSLDFHIGFLNKIPILWTVIIVIVLIGAIYYLVTGRNKEFAPVMAPSPDDPVPAAGRPRAPPSPARADS